MKTLFFFYKDTVLHLESLFSICKTSVQLEKLSRNEKNTGMTRHIKYRITPRETESFSENTMVKKNYDMHFHLVISLIGIDIFNFPCLVKHNPNSEWKNTKQKWEDLRELQCELSHSRTWSWSVIWWLISAYNWKLLIPTSAPYLSWPSSFYE